MSPSCISTEPGNCISSISFNTLLPEDVYSPHKRQKRPKPDGGICSEDFMEYHCTQNVSDSLTDDHPTQGLECLTLVSHLSLLYKRISFCIVNETWDMMLCRHHIPENNTLHGCCSENLVSSTDTYRFPQNLSCI